MSTIKRPRLSLAFWQSAGELEKFRLAMDAWWDLVQSWMAWPLAQLRAETAPLGLLNLLAWQRDIDRFAGEPEWLYRLRIQHAFANSQDAGTVAGFVRILERLGVGYVELEQRRPDRDWDVITLRVTDSQLSENPQLMQIILQMYGRTCRRYEFEVITLLPMHIASVEFSHDQQTLTATL